MSIKKYLYALLVSALALLTAYGNIQAGKTIQITISNVPDQDKATVSGAYPVSDGGMVNMPFIGLVRAAGMSSQALASSLQSRYKSAGIYRDPTIQVISNSDEIGPNQEVVVVGGQVKRSGPVPYTKELTIWQAIQAAGGSTEFGAMNRVRLHRNGQVRAYDLTKAQFMQIPLQRNDTIEVPQKGITGR